MAPFYQCETVESDPAVSLKPRIRSRGLIETADSIPLFL
jgi:hypothetical protein